MAIRRKSVMLIVVSLVVLNVWRWWSYDTDVRDISPVVLSESSFDLNLTSNIYSRVQNESESRDLFSYIRDEEAVHVEAEPAVTNISEMTGLSMIDSNRSEEAATDNLRLVGMLFKDNDSLAFILSHGDQLSVREGDVVNEHFRVIRITETSVKFYNMTRYNEFVLNL